MRERIGYYDMARGMGIIFVVIGHIDTFYMPFRHYITSFHMALFFIISGMLIMETGEEEKNLGLLVKKKWSRIMMPYFFFSILAILIEGCRIYLNGTFFLPHLQSLFLSMMTLYGNSVMWFLPALFLSEMVFWGIHKLAVLCCGRRRTADFVTIVSVMILVFCMIWFNILEQAFYANYAMTEQYKRVHEIAAMLIRGGFCTIFVGVGYYVRKYLMAEKAPSYLSGLAAVLLLAVSLLMNRICPGVELRGMLWGETDVWVVNYYVTEYVKAGMYLLGACCGALGIVCMCKAGSGFQSRRIGRGLSFLGTNSLTIMTTHLDFHVLHAAGIIAAAINVYAKSSFVYHTCLLLLVLVAEIVLVLVINRFFPRLVGKK